MSELNKLAIIGAGKLGEALACAMLESGTVAPERMTLTARTPQKLERLAQQLGVQVTTDNVAAVKGAEVVLLAVKPQKLGQVLEQIAGSLDSSTLLISAAAGVTISSIETTLGREQPVVRAMPNTPSRIRAGMTVVSPGLHATAEHLVRARVLFEAVGRTMVLEERHMDAVTGLSASGPAFLYVVLEAMAEGGVKMGLPRRVATELVAQAMLGASKLALETDEHPALLKDDVTTPAGCTIDGLLELEVGGLRVALIKAIVTTTRRARELGEEPE